MTKKRKIRKDRLIILVAIVLITVSLITLGIKGIMSLLSNNETQNEISINEIDYSEMKELDLDLHSKSYILVRLNDLKVLYGKNIADKFYPASLTKILTLNTVVNNVKDYNDVSSYSNEDYNKLINENASLAGLKTNYDYTIDDLLYALVLPSGGDGAKALENYFEEKGLNLVTLMNERCKKLGLLNSVFTNTTGLHDYTLYTSLEDYAKIVVDTLLNDEAKAILKASEHELSDGSKVSSTLSTLTSRADKIAVYGGKTGFTGEAGENIAVLYEVDNRSYLLVLTGANGNPYNGEYFHINDVNKILDFLYN